MRKDTQANELLEFWFGTIPTTKFGCKELASVSKRYPYWYGKAFPFSSADGDLLKRYEGLVTSARNGDLIEWEETLEGRLALILLLDQFPRNMYRGDSKAFESDEQALHLAKKSLALGDHLKVHSLARTFYFFTLMHQENTDIQDECVAYCKQNMFDAGFFDKLSVAGVYVSSLRHRYIVNKFKRYPHRNIILGRTSTKEEESFLRQPFSSF